MLEAFELFLEASMIKGWGTVTIPVNCVWITVCPLFA